MIIDCHGHYTTAPKALEAWRNRQIAGLADPAQTPAASELKIGDDELRESIETNQLAKMRERGIDLTIFSPRASFMAHHIGGFETSAAWAAICNELISRVCKLFPGNFIGAAMLPQSPGVEPATCLPELDRCVREYGFVAINLNPDPSGGHWTSPPLSDRHWYPIYERMVEYDMPAMIHVSTSCKKPPLSEHLLQNIYFDTCVYHQPGIDLLTKVIPVANVLFASEMIGAVRGIDPETGHAYDDTRRCIEAAPTLSDADRRQIFEGNTRRVYPRLDAVLRARETLTHSKGSQP